MKKIIFKGRVIREKRREGDGDFPLAIFLVDENNEVNHSYDVVDKLSEFVGKDIVIVVEDEGDTSPGE